jgi:polysaccharide pyruvyl transferase WcaK-like protein
MTDLLLEAWVSGLIEASKVQWMLGAGRSWQPGEKLKLLFAGYNGTRNTGSDVRVHEILRQVARILGPENVSLSVMTQNFELTRGYFGEARQVKLPDVFPPFLKREVSAHHGVIACEGSMFKSKFANALTTMMIGSLGIASAQNKLSIGFGAEAGQMDPSLEKMCRRYCANSFIITRNLESAKILGSLGVAAEVGTDTAWTFEPRPVEYGAKVLRENGWDGTTPILAVCPIHPFWWPVKASIGKALAHWLTGAFKASHYRSMYFHRSGRDVDAAYGRYLDALAGAVRGHCQAHRAFPIAIGMERLDANSCHGLSDRLGGIPVFASDRYDMYQLVSILRCSSRIVSSRYHALVTSMPAGIPSAGVTMDERIRNLMYERGQAHLLLEADDPDLENGLTEILDALVREREPIREVVRHTVAHNLRVMARMGVAFEECVAQCYPEFELRPGHLQEDDYLPELSQPVRKLMESYPPEDQTGELAGSVGLPQGPPMPEPKAQRSGIR